MEPVERPAALGVEAREARLLPLYKGPEVVHLLANVIVHGSNICGVIRLSQITAIVFYVTKPKGVEHRTLNVGLTA